MKTTKTFENATLRTVNNGYIELDYNGKTHYFHNASVISVNNGSISIEVDWKPERGELVKVLHTGINCYVIFNMIDPYASHLHTFGNKDIRNSFYKLDNDIWLIGKNTELHPVTPEEQQAFDDFCKSKGKIWNKEKLQWEKYKWEPEEYENYYFINSLGEVEYTKNDTFNLDPRRIKYGNCFQTKKQAEIVAEKLKEIFKSL